MDSKSMVSLKVYLFQHDSEEPEIRRFGIDGNALTSYNFLTLRVLEVFPKLSNKAFTIYWADEEGDEITISTDEELIVALNSMTSDVKKFYVKTKSLSHDSVEKENSVVHPGVYCDGCEGNIAGFRYKCVVCEDYDLCEPCEQAGIHDQHPMLKIPHPVCFDRLKIRMLPQFLGPFMPFNASETSKHHRRRHSHDGGHPDFCKKKKRLEKRERGHETGDEWEEGCPKKHSHISHMKCRKSNKCPYSQLINDVFGYFAPDLQTKQRCSSTGKPEDKQEGEYPSHLKTVSSTLQKLLGPLGVDVEYEVLPKKNRDKDKKNEEETEKKDEKQSSTSSAPREKHVKVTFKEAEGVKQKIDEITKMLASQSVSQGTSAENDGWVSFEELNKDSEEAQPETSSAEGTPSAPREEPKPPQRERETQEKENLYPNLSFQHVPVDPKVKVALEKMLAMGFTNEGNWLTSLLEAKHGDIDGALEVLAPYKKK